MTVVQNGAVLAPGNYTVAPVNNNYDNGGSVTLNTACPTGQTLFLQRVTPVTQLTQFTPYMPALYADIEDGLDQLTEIDQELYADYTTIKPACGTVPIGIPCGGTGATTAAQALANLGGLPLSGGTLTGALNGTSASFSGTVSAGSETLGSPLLPASGGTGATTAAGAWASITNGSQTGSGTSQLNTLPGTSSAVNFNFMGDSLGAIGVITANSSWYLLSGSIGYGVSTNANGGLDIMANQNGQSLRLWAGTANTAPTEVASFLNTGSVIYENLQVQGTLNNANGPVIPQTALGTQGPAAGYVTTSISGTATLVSGTVTVSSTAACAVSSSCHYSLTRYATNSSAAIGNLSVGTISAGSSFVINSLTATDTIATTDVSGVSWQVN
jgi:hypothetical protein